MTNRQIDARLLRTFVAVAEEGNVSRAAERLFLSQPAVSLQLKELAAFTQLELMRRTSKGIALTRDGMALLAHAERALEGIEDFGLAAQRLASRVKGTLRVGTILDPEFTRLGAFLRELVAHAPEVRPELQHGISGSVLARLASGELDAGYYLGDPDIDSPNLRRPERGGAVKIHAVQLSRVTYRVVAPAGWERRVAEADWAALVALPWVLTPPQSVHARLLQGALEPLGLKQTGVALVDQEESMLALVRSGVGLALARDAIAIRASQAEGLAIAGRVALDTDLSFITIASARKRPVVEAALEAIDRAWRR